MTSKVADKRTNFVVRDVDKEVSTKELATFLGLGQDAAIVDSRMDAGATKCCTVSVNSLDEAMSVFLRRNFKLFRGRLISLEFIPREIYSRIPCLQVDFARPVQLQYIYNVFSRFGTIISVFWLYNDPPKNAFSYEIYYTSMDSARRAKEAWRKGPVKKEFKRFPGPLQGNLPFGMVLKPHINIPDFWTPTQTPQKTKGSLIGVPTNVVVPANSAVPEIQVAHVVKSQRPNRPGMSSGDGQSPNKRTQETAADQRAQSASMLITENEYCLQPGEIPSTAIRTKDPRQLRSCWFKAAFIAYESLYNLSSQSPQGLVSISTLAWGSQLDISTFRLHYGSTFTPKDTKVQCPVASCLTVEMRQYGDKESAAEVLAIRNNGRLSDSCDALAEGINVTARGPIMSMKCLESGHLVTASLNVNKDANLYVWDMRGESSEEAKTPLARLHATQRGKLWFDAKRMDICSVDDFGTIKRYDLTKTAASSRTSTITVDYETKTDIDKKYRFKSSSISINGFDATVLVGSSEHAQIARWDPRSSAAPFTTMSCRDKAESSYGRKSFDPVYGVEWNPNNSNEFMTVHKRTVRVWDARKMDQDSYATFHNLRDISIRKAQWSPHRSDVIAGLTIDGQVMIWKINKFDGPADATTLEQVPKPLFLHQANSRVVTDFAWCPYLEDVVSTVSPGVDGSPGNIQVWRPRNLHSSDDHGEP